MWLLTKAMGAAVTRRRRPSLLIGDDVDDGWERTDDKRLLQERVVELLFELDGGGLLRRLVLRRST